MANVATEHWQFATVVIENDELHSGTAFFVGDPQESRGEYGDAISSWLSPATRAYLVTCRHLLGEDLTAITAGREYDIRYNASTPNGLESRVASFVLNDSPRNWAIHPDQNVDVAVLDATEFVASNSDIFYRICPFREIANPLNMAAQDVAIGDDVFVLGYPLTLLQGVSNLPLARKGVLATSPRRSLIDKRSGLNFRNLRGFLIDGAVVPGSSGSPVISTSQRFLPGDLAVTNGRPLLLGIVRQEWGRGEAMRYDVALRGGSSAPIGGYANLGFAHSAGAIIETLAEFRHFNMSELLPDYLDMWHEKLGLAFCQIEDSRDALDEHVAFSVFLRLRRDRMRKLGFNVPPDERLDAINLLGPIDAKT